MSSVLDRIARYKRDEVGERMRNRPVGALRRDVLEAPPPKGFHAALKSAAAAGYGLIAEVKKASPSKGLIRPEFEPVAIAAAYERGGAACVSVLTDAPSFQGSLDHLRSVSAEVSVPVLRKDFMLDPYQVWEARAAGADCVLIIMAMISDNQALALERAALELGMDCLIEVHDRNELERAARLQSRLVGINNRDLKTFEVSLSTTLNLLPHIPKGSTVVAESGLSDRAALDRLAAAGARCFLIGESLMRASSPEAAVRNLLPPLQESADPC